MLYALLCNAALPSPVHDAKTAQVYQSGSEGGVFFFFLVSWLLYQVASYCRSWRRECFIGVFFVYFLAVAMRVMYSANGSA